MADEEPDEDDNVSKISMITTTEADDAVSRNPSNEEESSGEDKKSDVEEDEDGTEEISTEDVLQAPRRMRHILDSMRDVEVVKTVLEKQHEIRYLSMENYIFEKFLNQNDKALLEGMEKIIEHAQKMQKNNTVESIRRSITIIENRTSTSKSFSETTSMLSGDKGPRVNVSQKSDLVLREIEDLRTQLDKFVTKAHSRKCKVHAHLEEISIREKEIVDSAEVFTRSVIVEGMDPLTQRIPAEKFVRYMQEWLKSSEITEQKLRLRISTLGQQIGKITVLLAQKTELGESLHAVDFEKLQIENRHFVEEIEVKNGHLIDLKIMNGKANLVLNNHKKYLQKQLVDMKKIQESIDSKKKKMADLERESELAEAQLEKAQDQCEHVQEMMEKYSVPDVMDYIKKKADLYDFRKNLKIWTRRLHIQNVAMNASIRHMKNITGSKKTQDCWFRRTVLDSDSEDTSDDDDDDPKS